MTNKLSSFAERLTVLASAYRKTLWSIAAGVAVYALLGFFLAPWLLQKSAIEAVSDNLHAELRLDHVAINPFMLSLRIDGLQLDASSGEEVANIDQVFINFQLSSLFRWAWTFDEFYITSPQLFVARDEAGAINLAGLAKPPALPADKPAANAESSPVRLLIHDFAIRDSVAHWNDRVPPEPVETIFGPINIEIAELNTLPQRAGQQAVEITTESEGTLSWSGSLQLNPINSAGRASIKGSHFPLISAYLRHETGFDTLEGTADIELDYQLSTDGDGSLRAGVENLELAIRDLVIATFNAPGGRDRPDREIFRLPSIELTGGSMRWPERIVSATGLAVHDADVNLYRDAAGELNIVTRGDAAADVEPADSRAAANPSQDNVADDWRLSLQQLLVNRMSVALEDDSVQPPAVMGIESLDLDIRDISNAPGAEFPTEFSLIPRSGGKVALKGTLGILPEPDLDFDLRIDSLALAGAHPYLKPLADVNLDSGALNMRARLQSSPEDALSIAGELAIVDLLITETDEGSRLGSWSSLDVRDLVFSSAGESLNIAEIGIDEPYGDIFIAEDGSANLGRVQKSGAEESLEEPGAEASPAAEETAVLPLDITVGRVTIANGAADFADFSLPLPFAAKIANLNGDMTTIATSSAVPSTVALEGEVDDNGFVRITGTVTPLDTSRNTNLKVAFQNVEMPKFSAYTVPFAGRKIASGKLDLDLGYKVTNSELVGENKIILRDLELGDKVPHPGAMSLPLGLAVALLKDADGKIDIDLPVRGNVDDPEFRYGGVVLKALGNLIVKIVASPFALLGNLLGAEASELEYITFIDGRADLTPPEMERAGKLAEALLLRPELVLELSGATDPIADGLALRTAKLDTMIENRLASTTAAESEESRTAERQSQVLEQIFTEQSNAGQAAADLDALRARFTTAAADEVAEPQFDALAYSTELRRQLIERQPLADAELLTLANERATNTRAAILQANAEIGERIVISAPKTIESESGDGVRMKLTLRTGAEEELNQQADGDSQ